VRGTGWDAGSFTNPLTLCSHNSGAASPAPFVGSSLLLQPTSVNIQIRALGCQRVEAFNMRKLAAQIMKAILVLAMIIALPFVTYSQSKLNHEAKSKPIAVFDWECAKPSLYPKAKLNKLVKEDVNEAAYEGVAIWGDRAYPFDLNADGKPEYFVPLVCFGSGNCVWGVYSVNPVRQLTTFAAYNIYIHKRVKRWSAITTFEREGYAAGDIASYCFGDKKYVECIRRYYLKIAASGLPRPLKGLRMKCS
jgi:hypothetical protein